MRISRRGVIAQKRAQSLYIWDVYFIGTHIETTYGTIPVPGMIQIYWADQYLESAGELELINPTYGMIETGTTGIIENKYVATASGPVNTLQYCSVYIQQQGPFYLYNGQTLTSTPKKGVSTGRTVESMNPNAYPENGVQGNFWYVLRS